LVEQAVTRKASDNVSCAVIAVPGARELGEKTEVQGILANPKLMAALQRVTVFQSLKENQRAMVGLLSLATVRRYPAGAVILAQGNASDELAVILAGEVDILEFGNVVVTRKAGEALGEIGFFTQSPRTASAIAKTAVDVLVIRDDDFQSLLARDPRLGLELARGVILELGRKLTEKARAQLWSG
jgi:CRP-like cAMP-binding protein